jgi:hypothetical protein
MAALIKELIDKKDSYEIIRDTIAAILEIEKEAQKVLAGASAALYDFDVYVERSNPWELITNVKGESTGKPPLVNVFFDTTSQDGESAQVALTHTYTGMFNIDCYGSKNSVPVPGNAHASGDELSARESSRVARLVRNILAYNEYRQLGISTIVNAVKIRTLNSIQPNIQDRPANNILVTRIILEIKYTEYNFETIPVDLQLVSNQCLRQVDDFEYFKADFNYVP